MRKQAIILASLVVIVAGLLGALYLVGRTPPAEEPPTLSMLGSVEVLRFDAPVVEVAVTPHDGRSAYTVISLPSDDGADAQSSTLVGREELPIDTAKTNAILASARRLESTRLLYEQSDDYASFGLANPSVLIKITDADRVSKTLLVGDLAPDRSNYYVQVQGEPAVYLMPSYRMIYFMLPEVGYMDTTVTTGSAQDFYSAQQITLGGTVRAEFGDIVVSPVTEREATPMDLHTHFLRSPVFRPLKTENNQCYLLTLFGLKASEAVALYPDAKTLAGYGLDEPYSTVAVRNLAGSSFTLLTSEPDGTGFVYLMKEGEPIVYKIGEDKVPWQKQQFTDMMSLGVYTLYLDEIDDVIVETGNRTYRFNMDHSDPARLAIHIDGREAHRSNFMAFAETLRRARYEELTFDPLPEGTTPVLQVTYTYVDGSPAKTFSFYQGPSRKYFVVSNDMDYRFYTASLYVDKAIDEVKAAVLPNE